ncbi:MAG: hypothetical protein J5817_11030 [Treponema sp.]|nr:hypothetical protein [Treponema sp.]
MRIVVFAALALIPYFLGRFSLYEAFRYVDAPYKYTVEATLVKKNKKVTDYWYADKKKCMAAGKNYAEVVNSDDSRFRQYKKHKYSVDYYLTWEYFIDGQRHQLTTSSWLVSFRSIGSKKSFRVFSQDGKEFTRGDATFSLTWFIIFALCALAMLVFVFCILGALFGIFRAPFKKKDGASFEDGSSSSGN